MRILHATTNTAGQGLKTAQAQRQLGYVSDCLIYSETLFKRGADINLNLTPNAMWPRRWVEKSHAFLTWAPRYDVFHFHATTFLDIMLDIPLLKALGKKVLMHYHGYELYPLFDAETSRRLYGDFAMKGRDRAYARIALFLVRRFADAVFVSEPEMAPWIPGAVWIPQPLDLEYWMADASLSSGRHDGVINIVHAPSNRTKKGTIYVERAVRALQDKGYPVQLQIVENMPYEQVKKSYQRADIFVDQLLCGWYGNASCEAMALEKPVCCYIRSDLFSFLGSCPIVNVTPETLESELIALIQDKDLRAKLGRRGRQYVAKVHDVMKIAAQCIEIYQRA